MHTEKSKIIFSDYCTKEEIDYCKKKLKAKLFSTFCKLAKEGERYILTYWYSQVPLSKNSTSVQLTINAVIKDRQTDTEDLMRKIIPNLNQKTLFSTLSSIIKLGKNHNKKIIGEVNKMIVKCQRCGAIVPTATSSEVLLLKEEIKKKDEIIANLQKDKEELMAIVEKLQAQENVEIKAEENIEPASENVTKVENLEVKEEDIVEELPKNSNVTETIIAEEVTIVPTEGETEGNSDEEKIEEAVEDCQVEETKEVAEDNIEGDLGLSTPDEDGCQYFVAPEMNGCDGNEIKKDIEENGIVVEEEAEETQEETPVLVEENAVVEEAKEEVDTPSEELPEENVEPIEETIHNQEEIDTEENEIIEEVLEEQPVEAEVEKAKEEDPYAIHTPIVKI